MIIRARENRYIAPGTKVQLKPFDGEPEYGVVTHCWHSDDIAAYDCYVAFFGSAFPEDQPIEKPYVLRYAATSLNVIDDE